VRSWVLMYHRVCEETPETQPWFKRGTAVTLQTFKAHLNWVLERYAVVPLSHIIASSAEQPSIALTFDDGYEELSAVAEVCAERGVTATCFATQAPILGQHLWFDLWYALTTAGLCSQSAAVISRESGLALDAQDWVRGPIRQWLGSCSPQQRSAVLNELHALNPKVNPPHYLSFDGLRRLQTAGWTVGGHGVHHVRLCDVDTQTVDTEILGSCNVLEAIKAPHPWLFAYPDGAYSDPVTARVRAAGFSYACTVERGAVSPRTDPWQIPRLFCRATGDVPHPLLATDDAAT
jgi:peptidoglycan/xylan/chitin deacetylase (PgdA/CDA1 family)